VVYNPHKLDLFPAEPGVYLMKSEAGEVLYVGKAKDLRQRIKQYFVPGRDGRPMIPYLVAKIAHIEPIVVFSEKEALLLENNLIKKYQPRYNALLKDDKAYIALKISVQKPWPRVEIVRYKGSPEADGLYFGPYTSAQAARETVDLLNSLFPLRQCSDQELARRKRPCLLYQMGRCIGPCGGKCSKEQYDLHLQHTLKFLRGQDKEIIKELYEEMERFSSDLEFEKAAETLKKIRFVERTIEQQRVDRPLGGNLDVWGVYRHAEEVLLCLLQVRKGKLIGSRHFYFNRIGEDDPELFESFLVQHYALSDDKPNEILVPVLLPSPDAIEDILNIKLHNPQRGDKKVLLEMAYKNAEILFRAEQSEETVLEKNLLEMQEQLQLVRYPHRIECFDTSNIAGEDPVATMVVFSDGQKDSKRYRSYTLQNLGKSDDYAGMREVLSRRYKRAKDEEDLPDLIIVDGGKGQLNIALQVLEDLDLLPLIDVIGLAKEGGRHDKGVTAEQIFLPHQKNPILLNKHSAILFLLQRIRDEAHRTAIEFHRKKRSKKLIYSVLDEVPGIGSAKKKALLIHFGSVKNIEKASEESLMEVKGISKKNAVALKAALGEPR
jgi:excinuclease ABC subunit C